MATAIPVLPSIPAGSVATAAELNQIGTCANFLLNKPITTVKQISGGVSISNGGTLITYGSSGVIVDTDGMWNSGNPGQLTVQTSGWYRLSYMVNFQSTSGDACNTAAFSTTGANNPQGSGITSDAYWAAYCDAFPGNAQCRGIWPFYLYEGDFVFVMAYAASGDTHLKTATADVAGNSGSGSTLSMEYIGTTP